MRKKKEFSLEDYVKGKVDEEMLQGINELLAKYRISFNSSIGRVALTDFLQRCGVLGFIDPSDPVRVGAYNAGIQLMVNLGILDFDPNDIRKTVIDQDITNALMNIPPKGGN